jgi:hypothetical protein
MSGQERAERDRPEGEMSDDELRAWALKRGRIAFLGFVLVACGVLGLLVWSLVRP